MLRISNIYLKAISNLHANGCLLSTHISIRLIPSTSTSSPHIWFICGWLLTSLHRFTSWLHQILIPLNGERSISCTALQVLSPCPPMDLDHEALLRRLLHVLFPWRPPRRHIVSIACMFPPRDAPRLVRDLVMMMMNLCFERWLSISLQTYNSSTSWVLVSWIEKSFDSNALQSLCRLLWDINWNDQISHLSSSLHFTFFDRWLDWPRGCWQSMERNYFLYGS